MLAALPVFAQDAPVHELKQQIPSPEPMPRPDQPDVIAGDESVIEVVFVLDTTGSMGGLIAGAKEKIWSIANAIATAQPRPTIRMGLVGYRDRGDAYITRITPLTDDLDAVYADLMAFKAQGGGDTPESVNQALHEAVTKITWSSDPDALKLIYLVGDCPPHMDYAQDIKYADSCELAAKAGLIVNTIQCGSNTQTTPIWTEIARLGEGRFFQIAQSGGVVAIATPYDEELTRLGADMDRTLLAYGSAREQVALREKVARSRDLADAAAPSAEAGRSAYKAGVGGSTLTGGQELIADLAEGKVKLDTLKEDELPEEMRKMTQEQRAEYVAEQAHARKKAQTRIIKLDKQRRAYIEQELAKAGGKKDSFDQRVIEALREQAARKGIVIGK